MNPLVRIPYGAAGALARALARVAPSGESKTLRALSSRRGIGRRYAKWAADSRDTSRPLLWVHAPSVGEGLQALPVIQLFRSHHPEAQLAYTFFSPSAEGFARSLGADFCDYLPFDTASDVHSALASLRPTALVFSKVDVWPVLAESAARKRVKLGLVSATMPASSSRRSRLARLALSDSYAALDAVGVVSHADAVRLIVAGARADRITVTGDTRYDQAWAKAEGDSSQRKALLSRLRTRRFNVVAGSTWPSDEERLLPAWLNVKAAKPEVRLVIAPHELSEKHLTAIEAWARSNGLRWARVGRDSAGVAPSEIARAGDGGTRAGKGHDSVSSADVVIVDRYGILGDLYALADVSYVGGGFRAAGLHSLLEPAAFGSPVIIGPRHTDNRDATLLIAAGGAFRCADADSIANRILRWLDAPESLAQARTAAREVVRGGLGAAERSVKLVEGLMFGG
jgi:3-deoxy-D-manno-octulosonic-acid transferase